MAGVRVNDATGEPSQSECFRVQAVRGAADTLQKLPWNMEGMALPSMRPSYWLADMWLDGAGCFDRV
jgi:hypothetical protein